MPGRRGWKWDAANDRLSIYVDGTEVARFDDATYDLNLLTNGVNVPTGKLNINAVAVTSTAAELNALDGITSTVAELNILDGVTSTAAELNILDGVTSTTAELNILDGVTSTAAELNILDGVTATAAEINKLDGIDPQIIYITAQIADISSASSTFIVMPACTVTNIWTVIDGAIITADAAITFENNAGTALTGGAITIATASSAAGDVDTCATTANNTFTEGQKLEIITDGASGNAVLARVTIKATRSS